MSSKYYHESAVNKTHINEQLNTSTVPEDHLLNPSGLHEDLIKMPLVDKDFLNDSIVNQNDETILSKGKGRMIGNYVLGKYQHSLTKQAKQLVKGHSERSDLAFTQ